MKLFDKVKNFLLVAIGIICIVFMNGFIRSCNDDDAGDKRYSLLSASVEKINKDLPREVYEGIMLKSVDFKNDTYYYVYELKEGVSDDIPDEKFAEIRYNMVNPKGKAVDFMKNIKRLHVNIDLKYYKSENELIKTIVIHHDEINVK